MSLVIYTYTIYSSIGSVRTHDIGTYHPADEHACMRACVYDHYRYLRCYYYRLDKT